MRNPHRTTPSTKFRPLLGAALAIGLATVTVFASAHPAGGEGEHHGRLYRQTDLAELHGIVEQVRQDAGPAQLAQLQVLETAARPQLEALEQAAAAARDRKIALLLADPLDRGAIFQASRDELRAADALAQRIDQALVDLAGTLTAGQRAQLREHHAAHGG